MARMESLGKAFFRYVRGYFITGECPFLEAGNSCHDLCRRAIPFTGIFMFKRAPAEEAAVVASQSRSHLYAPVALYAVELMLVTHFPPFQAFFTPKARLYGR